MAHERIPEIQLDRRTVLQSLGIIVAGASGVAAPASASDGESHDRYELPALPYDYDALEPYIDERIMELHHDNHHQGYVDGTNAALKELEGVRPDGDFEGIKRVKRDLSFNLSGHVNHSIFWDNMSPDGGGEPSGELRDRIERGFGSVGAFRDEFTEAAKNVESNGWAMLYYEPTVDRLIVGQVESQNRLAHQGATPLLTLDVWEHAYYLQYENRRGDYVDRWWCVVDWDDVAERYDAARTYWTKSD